MKIQNISPEDLDGIAEIHLNSFSKEHFTSRFSKKMLIDYYSILTTFEKYNLIVLNEENQILGYLIAGSKYQIAINKYIKEHYFQVIKVLLTSPPSLLLEKVKSAVTKLTSKPQLPVKDISIDIIAVNALLQKKGVGSNLIAYLENELLKDGIQEYFLFVRDGNKSAIDFYLNKNFKIVMDYGSSMKLRKELKVTEKL